MHVHFFPQRDCKYFQEAISFCGLEEQRPFALGWPTAVQPIVDFERDAVAWRAQSQAYRSGRAHAMMS